MVAAIAFAAVLASPLGANAQNCVVIHDVTAGTTWRSDDRACAIRLSPASTFKIPHALVALETGAIKPDSVERWDGTKFPRQTVWQKDHTLRSAIPNSVLWFFQRTAPRIGAARMKSFLQQFQYGNADTSGDVTTYWIDGTLRVSAIEQVEFLKRFFAADLPVTREHITFVRDAMLQEPGTMRNARGLHKMSDGWDSRSELVAKTGGTTVDGSGVSWLVGALKRGERTYVFTSAVWRAGAVDPLEGARQAFSAFAKRGLL